MINVDFHDDTIDDIFGCRKTYDDDRLITIHNVKNGYTDNWGDDDCRKMVTLVNHCDIEINQIIAHDFDTVNEITFLRYDYYNPAYAVDHDTKTTKEILPNGNLVYHVRKIET